MNLFAFNFKEREPYVRLAACWSDCTPNASVVSPSFPDVLSAVLAQARLQPSLVAPHPVAAPADFSAECPSERFRPVTPA